jgi:hypothetical protein
VNLKDGAAYNKVYLKADCQLIVLIAFALTDNIKKEINLNVLNLDGEEIKV